ncbi:hypothetical protein D9O50_02050 [Oxalobacteraceae bacterium CAVE-383]|nr:hypothetical protein D9O50_02050 [Oxalobacteraceae bacterium CAVE-383]
MKDRPSPLGGEVFHTGNRRLSQSSTGTASSIASNLEAEFKAEAEPGSWEQVGKELGFFRERPVKVQAGKASAAKNPAAASGKPAPAVRWVISDGRWQKASDVAELAAKQAQTASTASNRPAANVVKTLTPVPQPVQERHVIYRSDPPPAEKKAVRPFAETFEEARPKRVSRLIDFWENHGALITPLPAPSKDR